MKRPKATGRIILYIVMSLYGLGGIALAFMASKIKKNGLRSFAIFTLIVEAVIIIRIQMRGGVYSKTDPLIVLFGFLYLATLILTIANIGKYKRAVEGDYDQIINETVKPSTGADNDRYTEGYGTFKSDNTISQKVHENRLDEEPIHTRILDVNDCSEMELALVPGIGVVKAKRAITEREKNGYFESIDDFFNRVDIKPHNVMEAGQYLVCNRREKQDISERRGRKVDV